MRTPRDARHHPLNWPSSSTYSPQHDRVSQKRRPGGTFRTGDPCSQSSSSAVITVRLHRRSTPRPVRVEHSRKSS